MSVHHRITLNKAKDDFKVVVNGSEVKVSTVKRVNSGENSDHKLVLVFNQQVNLDQAATVTIVDEDAQADKTMAVKDAEGNKAKAGSTTTASNYKYNGSYVSEVELVAAKADAEYTVNKSALTTEIATQKTAITNATTIAAVLATVKALVSDNAQIDALTVADIEISQSESKVTVTIKVGAATKTSAEITIEESA
ncbi:hypothetical protein QN089_02070 [Kurthia sp. YJT4]|uniref:hypothetical protein n=1 Tax=Kurthia sp. YJT4 TaxID=3049086 RepID=UPI0025505A57|nr:hypothetical protein [Kurthia sp. YJT4]WIL39067.1 hypothetical protein QN089_02070 [Kurthia sp. YJT4]